MSRPRNGAELLCDALADAGVDHVFGVPGTQTIDLWEALRRRGRPVPVVATTELAASFMANGYARATGRPGVVATIPGPGFAFALPGLAEARLDSAPLVHLAGAPARREDGGHALQAIPQAEIAGPLVKRVLTAETADGLATDVAEALAAAVAGEPGPVLLQVPEALLGERVRRRAAPVPRPPAPAAAPAPAQVETAAALLRRARRPLLLCGQGAAGAADGVAALARLLPAPVLTTTSGRGVVPETDPLALPFDAPGAPAAVVNALVAACDLVLALGVKFSHNGSFGFALRCPPDRLVRVDASAEALARPYPAAVRIEADVGAFLAGVLPALAGGGASTWDDAAVARWRGRLAAVAGAAGGERLAGRPAAEVFAALRAALPEEAVVTTDSGLHQYLVRRHLRVLRPRTLVVPADCQSMGFGLPAAIGAAVATGRPAVAVLGDGGFAAGGLELATAVAAGLPLVVLVLVDGAYGLIRLQQLRRTGHASGVELPPVGLEAVASAVGARYRLLGPSSLDAVFGEAVAARTVTVVEVPAPGERLGRARLRGHAVAAAAAALGPAAAGRLADAARRRAARGG